MYACSHGAEVEGWQETQQEIIEYKTNTKDGVEMITSAIGISL